MARTNVRATRYAEAAFAVARGEGRLEEWAAALNRTGELFSNGQAEQYLTSPVVPPDRKAAALGELLPDLAPTVRNFLELLAHRDRLELIPEIVVQFRRLVNEERGIQVATVTTAVSLDTGQRERIAARLAERTGKQVTLETRIDPSIIGGVVAQIGDDVIDDSVRGRLERLRQSMMV